MEQEEMRIQTPARVRSGAGTSWHIISGSTLKMIAAITMLIDHFAAGIIGRYLYMRGGNNLDWRDMDAYEKWMEQNETLFQAYNLMREIGRCAFPIYCFLLAEGLIHTKDRRKYAGRLFLFAFISEIPFDLLFKGKILEFSHQNVFFTLCLGVTAVIAIDWILEKEQMHLIIRGILCCAAAGACMAAADALRTDYGARGVLCIVIICVLRNARELQIAAGACSFLLFLSEMAAPYAFISIAMYSGKRGWKLKYFFYLFYPGHLLLLYLLSAVLGISAYPAW